MLRSSAKRPIPLSNIRTTPDGAIIWGGEDEEIDDSVTRDAKIEQKAMILAQKLGKLPFGDRPDARLRVGGQFRK
ncbi:hypothetical protein [Sphingopyxis terrae]|uniref:hypothetical protein n=1 Tax=Sphingopyxis terrae TaxID=33052 RepID=UPI000A369F3F|nr:hypothetical protein [Sphingopyxis terrae]PCF91392.1 hypothetical protein CPA46_08040 [Sphingopyxis terrae subsp. ummariensis]